jgi:Uma2 family endonuclease
MAIDPETIHRLTADEYHRMIDSGGFDENARIELIDGLLLDMSPKTPRHENVIAFLARWLFGSLELDRYQPRVGAPLSIGDSEPEPDLSVIERGTERPYHYATAALVIEVAVSSQRRDLRTKPAIYARAGVPVYWVIDVERGRAVSHMEPGTDGYTSVEIVTELSAPHIGLDSLPVANILAAAG